MEEERGGGGGGTLSNVKRFLQHRQRGGQAKHVPADDILQSASPENFPGEKQTQREESCLEDTSGDAPDTTTTPASVTITATTTTTATTATTPRESSNVGDGSMLRSRVEHVERLLTSEQVDLQQLRNVSWSGLAPRLRAASWRLLLGYAPASSSSLRRETLRRKRNEYRQWVKTYYESLDDSDRTEDEVKTLRQITVDAPRTAPGVGFFHQDKVQESLIRVLYIRAIRYPASGYVQGLNDLVTPFLAVFIREACEASRASEDAAADAAADADGASGGGEDAAEKSGTGEEVDVGKCRADLVLDAEADCFWCLGRLIDQIQDHYTFAQPGIQRSVFRVRELVRRIDAPVAEHFEEQGVEFLQFTFRWINCLLVREVPFSLAPRLWDTYIAEGADFADFLVYVCAAFLLTWSTELIQLGLEDLVMRLQAPDTDDWGIEELEVVLSRAHIMRTMFRSASSHMRDLSLASPDS